MTTARTTTAARVRPRYRLLAGIAAGALIGVLIGLVLTMTIAPPGVIEPGAVVVVGLPVARALLDLAAVVTVGVSFLPKLLGDDRPKRSAPVLALGRRIAVASSAVWLVAAIASLMFETADLNVGLPLTFAEITSYVRQIASGQALVIVACSALIYLVIGLVSLRRGEAVPAELRITVALFTLLPLPVTGHADSGTSWQDINMISMELHVVGAVAWTGGLLAVILLVAANRSLLAFALPRYSKIATVCVFLVMVTGVFNGWLELYQTPGVHWYLALFTSGYGQILLLKGGCLTAAALLGAHTRFKLLPKIAERRTTAVATWALLELTVMGLAFGLAAVLVRAPVINGS
ncbi:MAG TPA: CopD family protein [Pseudonocardiaceae bacterium]|jgi:putative copper resistance protein D|nr:CopD family protein [Pseudonocardiaceae bacterium]